MGTATVPLDIWATATGDEAGLPTIYRYRSNRPNAVDCSKYPWAMRIVWPYDGAVRNGMPPAEDNALQVGFEDAIEALGEGRPGYLMLVFTGNGRKEWLYYVSDPALWLERLNESLKDHAVCPLRIEDWRDDAWETWKDFADSVVSGAN